MNMREHLDALCDVKVWWRKSGVKCSWIHWPSIDDDAAHRIAYANCYESALGIDHAFRNRAMHQEYPGHVLYVKFHGDETTCYLLDSDGALVNRTVLLRNPDDEPNAYALWAYIVREMVPEKLMRRGCQWSYEITPGCRCDVSVHTFTGNFSGFYMNVE